MDEELILNEAFMLLSGIFNSDCKEGDHQYKNLDKEFLIESIRKIAKSYYERSLIIFLGAGCSIEQKYPSWNEYIENFLEFWTYHINIVSEHDEILQCDMEYIKSLKFRNDIEKKRKIDLAYEVIKKYTPNSFIEVKHDFEKLQFIDSSPRNQSNDYYNILSELDAFYVTTNYDQQLEKILESKGKQITVYKDIKRFIEDEERKKSSGILYIHGTIGGNHNLLINSSESYINLYGRNESYMKTFREIIDKSNTTILFIGSSMDEEEILSIFYTKKLKCSVFSLLRSRDEVSDRIENEYFKDKKNIDVLRFGSQYKDLKVYLKVLTQTLNKLHKDNSLYDTIEFKGQQKRIIEIDEELSKSDLTSDGLKNIPIYINGDIFDATKYPKTWDKILNRTKLVDISMETKLNLIDKINLYNMKLKESIIIFLEKNIDYFKQMDLDKFFLKMRFLFTWGDYSIGNDFYKSCLFLYELENRNLEHTNMDKNIGFKLDYKQKEKLICIIVNENKNKSFSNINWIIGENLGNNIKYLIKNNLLEFRDPKILQIFSYKYVQKIFVYLVNNNEFNNKEIIDIVTDKINFDDEYFGNELNQFVIDHKIDSKIGKYKNYIGDSISGTISSVPYLTKENIMEKGVKLSFSYILDKDYPKINFMNLEEYTDEAQAKEFNKLLDGKNNDLFYEIYNYILKNKEMFDKFGSGILENKIIIEKKFKKILDQILDKYIENDTFDYKVSRFYEENLNNDNYNVKEKLRKYDLNKLIKNDKKIKTNLEEIKLIQFINTDIGRYIDVIKKIDKIKDDISIIVENIVDKEIRNYLKGVFFYQIRNQIDDKNSFIGFSHNYLINRDVYNQYQTSIIEILKNGTNDEFIIKNLITSVLSFIPTKDIKKIEEEIIKKTIPIISGSYNNIYNKSRNLRILINKIVEDDELSVLLLKNMFNQFVKMNKEAQLDVMEFIKNIKSHDKFIEPYGIYSNIYSVEKDNRNSIINYNKLIILLINNNWFMQDYNLKSQLKYLFRKYIEFDCNDLILILLEETKDFIKPFYKELREEFKNIELINRTINNQLK